MSSDAVVNSVKPDDEKNQKKGLHVLGYVVPWWVVVVVVVVVLYLAYTHGYLERVVGKPRVVTVPSMSGGYMAGGGFGIETPEQVRELFRNNW